MRACATTCFGYGSSEDFEKTKTKFNITDRKIHMSVVVVGSVAFDSIRTPSGNAERVLGGSANYFSIAAHFFSPVKMVAVVGDDFPDQHIRFLNSRNICTKGLEKISGKTFFWQGSYDDNLNEAKTLATHLNVFETFNPLLPEDYRSLEYVFLANIDPELQHRVLRQIEKPRVVVSDTMNFWIDRKANDLKKVLMEVDIFLLNEAEAKKLSGENNIVRASKRIRELGPDIVVIKRGEYGALLDYEGELFSVPAFPLAEVRDPTGAGDSFAGGFLGYLVQQHATFDFSILKRAVIYGTVMASFTVEAFSFQRLMEIRLSDVEKRFTALMDIVSV